MLIVDFVVVLIIVLVLTAAFGAGYRRHRGAPLMAFFLILFTLTWAVGVWALPVGYPLLGVYWLPFLAAGIVFTLLLLVLLPPPPRSSGATSCGSVSASETELFGVYFWILIVALMLVVLSGYLYGRMPAS